MTIEEVLINLNYRFTSGNSIPCDRAIIKADEYKILKEFIESHLEQFP